MDRKTIWAVAPFAAWIALMMALPPTAAAYAIRVAVAAVLLVGWFVWGRSGSEPAEGATRKAAGAMVALIVGLAVCAIWIWPERFEAYRTLFTTEGLANLFHPSDANRVAAESPYDPAVCGWTLTWVRLWGSALVIAPIEEMFFRSFLYRRLQKADWTTVSHKTFDLSAFLWTVGLFALEHDRWLVGAVAGVAYGLVYCRFGLFSAALAHIVTNLALGLWVIDRCAWSFW